MDAGPSLKRLDFYADFGVLMGSFALIIGLILAFTSVGLLPFIGTSAAVFGGIFLLGGITSRSVASACEPSQRRPPQRTAHPPTATPTDPPPPG